MPHLKRAGWLFAAGSLAVAGTTSGHVPGALPDAGGDRWLIVTLLCLAVTWYGAGWFALWPHLRERREHAWRAAAYLGGCLALAALLLGPIDAVAPRSFAVHMIQHEGLMLVAAPLLVLGRPFPLYAWGLPARARGSLVSLTHTRWLRAVWGVVTAPFAAWLLHAAALWLWHAPPLFDAAVRDPTLHEWQHVSFLLSALIFWHALLRRQTHGAQGAAVVYLFTTTIHTGVLGALLSLAHTPYYAALQPGLGVWWGLTPLEDQQLGGLIMWVPGALVYVGVGLWLAARWISGPRSQQGAQSLG